MLQSIDYSYASVEIIKRWQPVTLLQGPIESRPGGKWTEISRKTLERPPQTYGFRGPRILHKKTPTKCGLETTQNKWPMAIMARLMMQHSASRCYVSFLAPSDLTCH